MVDSPIDLLWQSCNVNRIHNTVLPYIVTYHLHFWRNFLETEAPSQLTHAIKRTSAAAPRSAKSAGRIPGEAVA
jgi:hypothetical protein